MAGFQGLGVEREGTGEANEAGVAGETVAEVEIENGAGVEDENRAGVEEVEVEFGVAGAEFLMSEAVA